MERQEGRLKRLVSPLLVMIFKPMGGHKCKVHEIHIAVTVYITCNNRYTNRLVEV